MPKKITRKLVILSVLVAALAAVSSASTSSANGEGYCLYEPVSAECPSGVVCCTGMGNCLCRN